MQDENEPQTAADIAAERVLKRIRLMTTIALATLMIGFFSILAAIAYRLMKEGDTSTAATSLSVESGSRIISAATGDGFLAVTLEKGGKTEIVLYDLSTLKEKRRISVTAN